MMAPQPQASARIFGAAAVGVPRWAPLLSISGASGGTLRAFGRAAGDFTRYVSVVFGSLVAMGSVHLNAGGLCLVS